MRSVSRASSLGRTASGVLLVTAVLVSATAAFVAPAHGEWVVASADGRTELKLGVLAQGRAEWMRADKIDPVAQNLYLRRARILCGGQVHPDVEFFLQTDSPDIGLPIDHGKGFDNFFLQDAVTTWRWRAGQVVDAGLLLTPGSYNHLQDEARFLTLDYGPYTMTESGPLVARVGRDTGAQARGLLLEKKVEYRLGVFSGVRGTQEANAFRMAGRVAVYPFETATMEYFYPGTRMGKANDLSLGFAFDVQKSYTALHGDLFVEQMLRPGSTLTFQVDFSRYDGGEWLEHLLPQQDAAMAELGFSLLENRLGTYLQAARRSYEKGWTDDEQVSAGLTWRVDGHHANLKLDWTRVRVREADNKCIQRYHDRDVITLQCQAWMF